MTKAYKELFPEPALSPEMGWGKIVNPNHHARVSGLLSRTKGEILIGGETEGDQKLALAIVAGVKPDDSLMSEYVESSRHNRVALHY